MPQEYSGSTEILETLLPEQDAPKMPPDELCFGGSQERNRGWKNAAFSGGFTEPADLSKCSTHVSDGYTITGYRDEEHEDLKVEVNGEFLLSLRPKVVGRVIGLDFGGQPVPRFLNMSQKQELLKSVSLSREGCSESVSFMGRGAVTLKTFTPNLRTYVTKRAGEVFVDISHGDDANRGVAKRYAYCMRRELLHGEKYGWAESALGSIRATLRKNQQLNVVARSLLTRFFDAALPVPVEPKPARRLVKVYEGRCHERRRRPENNQGERQTEEQRDVQSQFRWRRSKRRKLVHEFVEAQSYHEAPLLSSVFNGSRQDSGSGRLGQDVDLFGSVGNSGPGMCVKAWRAVKKRLKDSLMRWLS